MRKIADGSSIIDILVYQETCKGRCVYLDYRTNPVGGALTYDALLPEAQEYLTCAGVCFGTPSSTSFKKYWVESAASHRAISPSTQRPANSVSAISRTLSGSPPERVSL